MRELIVQCLARRPFRPFRVALTGGTVFEVRDPDLAEVRATVLDLHRTDAAAPNGRALRCTLALQHVVRLEFLEADNPVFVAVGVTE